MNSEIKLDDSFLEVQFLIWGYNVTFRFDRNKNGGAVILHTLRTFLQGCWIVISLLLILLFIEINLCKKKWLNCSYSSQNSSIGNHLELLRSLGPFSSKQGNIILLGDFNSKVHDNIKKGFCNTYYLKNLIKQPTCFKIPMKSNCIDLIWTNKPQSFQTTCVIEPGLSDFHRMTTTTSVLKMHFRKTHPKVIGYRN